MDRIQSCEFLHIFTYTDGGLFYVRDLTIFPQDKKIGPRGPQGLEIQENLI